MLRGHALIVIPDGKDCDGWGEGNQNIQNQQGQFAAGKSRTVKLIYGEQTDSQKADDQPGLHFQQNSN